MPLDGVALPPEGDTAWYPHYSAMDETIRAIAPTGGARAAGETDFLRRAGAGALTNGDVITLGRYAFHDRADAGTSVVIGGGNVGQDNVVGGNVANVDTATSNRVNAAPLTDENGNWDFLLGGYDTVVNGWACIVAGFHNTVEAGASHVVIAGGSRQDAKATAQYSTISGGTMNEVSAINTTVAGGNNNKATDNSATVSGGANNTASGNSATVGGGVGNTATGNNSTIVGGNTNTASDMYATVMGGLTCSASAVGATVPGGRDNSASGAYSVATGRGAVAIEPGQHAHAQQEFVTPGDAQINRWSLKTQTTGATAGALECISAAPPVIPENTTWAFNALVAARTVGGGDSASFEVKGCFKRDAGNTAALVGTPTVTSLGASTGAEAWTLSVSNYSVGHLRLVVTGEAGKTVRWVGDLHAPQVGG